MKKRYQRILKWVLYSVGFLLLMLINTVPLGNRTVFGAKLSLVPVYVCCVACREGHESGGIFALAASLFWALSGVTGGAVYVLLLPAASIVAGFFCNAYLTRSLLPAMASCLLALALCEGGIYVQRTFMGAAMPSNALALLGIQVGCSVAVSPLFWWLTRLVGKVGG